MSEEEADGGTCAICGVGVRWGSRCNDHLVRHEPLSGPVYYPRVPYHGSGKETVLHTFTEKRLAEHDRHVRAEAWQEGRESVARDFLKPLDGGMRPASANPYLGDDV